MVWWWTLYRGRTVASKIRGVELHGLQADLHCRRRCWTCLSSLREHEVTPSHQIHQYEHGMFTGINRYNTNAVNKSIVISAGTRHDIVCAQLPYETVIHGHPTDEFYICMLHFCLSNRTFKVSCSIQPATPVVTRRCHILHPTYQRSSTAFRLHDAVWSLEKNTWICQCKIGETIGYPQSRFDTGAGFSSMLCLLISLQNAPLTKSKVCILWLDQGVISCKRFKKNWGSSACGLWLWSQCREMKGATPDVTVPCIVR